MKTTNRPAIESHGILASVDREDDLPAHWFSRFLNWLGSFALAVAFPALVALIGAFAGLWVSVYSTELKNSFARIAKDHSFAQAGEPHVLVAAGLFVGFFVVFAAQQFVQTRASARAQRELIQETDTLRKMVAELKTMPSAEFLRSFKDSYGSVQELQLFTKLSDAGNVDHVTMIQSLLRIIATLAQRYDKRRDNVSYSANVMVYWDNTQLQKMTGTPEATRLLDATMFADSRDEYFTSGSGLLELIPNLAASADGVQHSPLELLVLPVSSAPVVRLSGGDRFNVLPGAPFAISIGQFAHYDSIETMLKWCRDEADISIRVREQLQAYFHTGKGKDVRSFLSIPLTISGARVGVVNVQASAPRMLDHGGTLLFVPVVTPLISLLTYLVANWVVDRERERALIGPKAP